MVLLTANAAFIYECHKKDYSLQAIVHLIRKNFAINISLRTLQRYCKMTNLSRKNIEESPTTSVVVAILLELEGSGATLGYRAMWKRLRNEYDLKIKQKTVMSLLKIIDSDAVEARSRYRLKRRVYTVPGPNYIWHADGHDKLKRFGFAIYGAIDGYSKKIMWLTVATTNNNPEVMAHQYLTCVEKKGFIPTFMRTDRGTEVIIMEDFHVALRVNYNNDDDDCGFNSFLKGKSTHNQRIESFWRQLKQRLLIFYIDFFKEMEVQNILDVNNKIHVECLRFCFGLLIQHEIDVTRKEWNEHRIRKQQHVMGGVPNELYQFPEKYGHQDYKKLIDVNPIEKTQ